MSKRKGKYLQLDGLVGQWPDSGCEGARAIVGAGIRCLECPLSECLEVLADNARLEGADEKVRLTFALNEEGVSYWQIALATHASQDTVAKILKGE